MGVRVTLRRPGLRLAARPWRSGTARDYSDSSSGRAGVLCCPARSHTRTGTKLHARARWERMRGVAAALGVALSSRPREWLASIAPPAPRGWLAPAASRARTANGWSNPYDSLASLLRRRSQMYRIVQQFWTIIIPPCALWLL